MSSNISDPFNSLLTNAAQIAKELNVSGVNCNIPIVDDISPVTGPSSASMKLTDTTQFTVNITKIYEMDSDGKIIQSLDVTKLTWTEKDNSGIHHVYEATNDTFTLTVTTYIRGQGAQANTTFGGQNIHFPSSSIEQDLTLDKWPFATVDNKLQIISTIFFPQKYTINDKVVESKIDSTLINNKRVQSVDVDTAYGTFVGQFPNRAILDKKIIMMDISILDQSADNLRVAMTVPSFTDTCTTDPIYVARSKSPKIDPATTAATTGSSSTIIITCSVYYLVGGTVTLSGQDLTLPSKVTIGNNTCTDIKLLSDKAITCYYDGNVISRQVKQLTNITFSDTYVQTFLAYLQFTLDKCSSDCQGSCMEGACLCKYTEVSGVNCNIPVVGDISPMPGPSSASMKLTNTTQFTVNITAINEVDLTGKIIQSLDVTKLTWTLKDPSVSNVYVATNGTFTMAITTNIQSQGGQVNTSFGGQDIHYPSASVKHSIALSKWPFVSADNKLQTISTIFFPTRYTINDKVVDSQIASTLVNKRVQSVNVDTAYGTIVGQFPNRAILDGVIIMMDINILDQSFNNLRVAMTVPSFTTTCNTDPIYVASSKSPKIDPVPTNATTDSATTTGSATTVIVVWSMIIMSTIIVAMVAL
eukprot:gene18081-21608_t